MARGGVYLAGGITARIAPVVKAGGFRAAFIDKWPHGKLMERIATAIITKEDAALAGIAAFARTPSRYGVEVGGRRWQG
jgi:glucokinase